MSPLLLIQVIYKSLWLLVFVLRRTTFASHLLAEKFMNQATASETLSIQLDLNVREPG
jgi:hypothetical protein